MNLDDYRIVVRGLAIDVSSSLDDACDDFARFCFRYPSPAQLAGWCVEAIGSITREPVDVVVDEPASRALRIVGALLLLLGDDASRTMLVKDFWRAYAAVSAVDGALHALEALDTGDQSAADRAHAAMEERYEQMV